MKSTHSAKHNVRVLRAAFLSALAVGSMAVTMNVQAASTSADATATVILPISIAKVADLRFGKFAANTGGTVVMSAASARSATSTVVLSASAAGGAASFTVTGEPSTTYAITLPVGASPTTITGGGGADTMTVGTYTSTPSATGTTAVGGTQTLLVGATLNVASGQAAGAYTGSFSVTVDYN